MVADRPDQDVDLVETVSEDLGVEALGDDRRAEGQGQTFVGCVSHGDTDTGTGTSCVPSTVRRAVTGRADKPTGTWSVSLHVPAQAREKLAGR